MQLFEMMFKESKRVLIWLVLKSQRKCFRLITLSWIREIRCFFTATCCTQGTYSRSVYVLLYFRDKIDQNLSDKNDSSMRRCALIVSVNKRKNNPTKKHHHPQYHPLHMLPNSAIMECQRFNSSIDKDYNNPDKDKSHRIDKKWNE